MKKKLFVGVGLVVLLGGSAFVVVATAGTPVPIDYGIPGTDAYYTSDEIQQTLPDIMANLALPQRSSYADIKATVVYRVGGPLSPEVAAGRFPEGEARLRDAFIMLISSKTPADVQSAEQKELASLVAEMLKNRNVRGTDLAPGATRRRWRRMDPLGRRTRALLQMLLRYPWTRARQRTAERR